MYRCKYPNRPGFCSPSLTPYSDRPEEQTPHFYTKVKDPLTSAENCHKAFKFINPQLLLTAFHQAALPLSALLLPDFLIRSSLHKQVSVTPTPLPAPNSGAQEGSGALLRGAPGTEGSSELAARGIHLSGISRGWSQQHVDCSNAGQGLQSKAASLASSFVDFFTNHKIRKSSSCWRCFLMNTHYTFLQPPKAQETLTYTDSPAQHEPGFDFCPSPIGDNLDTPEKKSELPSKLLKNKTRLKRKFSWSSVADNC